MSFKHGVHYKIDKPLIEMMLRHNMFDVQDDVSRKERSHPQLFINKFEIHSGTNQANPLYKGDDVGTELVNRVHSTLGLVMLAGVVVLAAAAAVSIIFTVRFQSFR